VIVTVGAGKPKHLRTVARREQRRDASRARRSDDPRDRMLDYGRRPVLAGATYGQIVSVCLDVAEAFPR
jgi:hypothetical protein